MNLQTLKARIKSGAIDTVVLGCPDVFGRLVGKRFAAQHFVKSVAEAGTHGCNYLLTVDIEMEPLDGFKLANWEKGFGDFLLRPILETARELPWQPGAVLILADFHHHHGEPVAEAPRHVLQRQVAGLAAKKLTCYTASELEFFLYHTSYPEAWENGYRDLVPSSQYRIDYHLMQPARDESLFREVRNMMQQAGVPVESSKGEWGRGQHEVNFVYDQPIPIADIHTVFKQGIKEIAAGQNKSITFMPKPSMTEPGNSCHIHTSLWQNGRNQFWDSRRNQGSRLFQQFLGGLVKYSRELCYFFAPTINAYKRYQAASWAPTRLAWAHDNRTVGFRVVGEGNSFRIENRMPGADANPYLAFAATLAAGMAGVRENLDAGQCYEGNAYVDSSLPRLPETLHEAAELLDRSKLARQSLGDDVVDFYVHTARMEVRAFNNVVTDWERQRYFERI